MQSTFDVVVLSYGKQGHVVTAFAGEGQFNVVAAQIRTRKFGTFKPHRFWICHDISIDGVEIRVGVKFDPTWKYVDYQALKLSIRRRFEQGRTQNKSSGISVARLAYDTVPFVLRRSKAAKVLTETFPDLLQVMSSGKVSLVLCTRISPDYSPSDQNSLTRSFEVSLERALAAKAAGTFA